MKLASMRVDKSAIPYVIPHRQLTNFHIVLGAKADQSYDYHHYIRKCGHSVVTEPSFCQLILIHVHVADAADAFVGGIVPPSALSAGYAPSYHSTPPRHARTLSPPCGPPPSFPRPSASAPPSHLPHRSVPQPSSLYNPTHRRTPSGLTSSRASSGTPQPSAQDQRTSSYATTPAAKVDTGLQLLCVPLAPVESALFHLSSGSCGPLLKYDTVVNGIWYGACMIVSAYRPYDATEFH